MIILASKSPRRKEILEKFNIEFRVVPSTSDEKVVESSPKEMAACIAKAKAEEVAASYKSDTVIGADTIVVIDNEILGKPKDEEDAIRMLSMLQNRTHEVITGVCIIESGKEKTFSDVSKVTFHPMTKDDILNYIHKEYVYDKAGSYAVQGEYATFIKEIEGSYYNVMGLPIERLIEELKK